MTNRDQIILEGIQAGKTYAVIGHQLGISRERVRQLVGRLGTSYPVPEGHIPLGAAARLLGYSKNGLYKYVLQGKIPSVLLGSRLYVYPKLDRGNCGICGAPIEKGRRRYCSEECLRVARHKSHLSARWR